jgi:hypothetical protein
MLPSKKTAAALVAVTAYMQQQEAAAQLAAPKVIPADTYHQLYALYLQLRTLFEGRLAA